MNVVYLSERNLKALLSKLKRPDSAKAILKMDTVHPTYPCTRPTMVIAVANDDYYTDREPGAMHPKDEPKCTL